MIIEMIYFLMFALLGLTVVGIVVISTKYPSGKFLTPVLPVISWVVGVHFFQSMLEQTQRYTVGTMDFSVFPMLFLFHIPLFVIFLITFIYIFVSVIVTVIKKK